MSDTQAAPSPASSTQTWPHTRFYWAVLDAPGYTRSGILPPGLLPALADEIPEPIDALHAVCTPIPRESPAATERVLVCACAAADLAEVDPHILELTPDAIPITLDLCPDIALPNLLTGEHEPAPHRSARLARHTIAALAILLCSMLISVGLARRTRHFSATAAQATRTADALLGDLTPDRRESTLATSATNTTSLASAARASHLPRDAAVDLASLLSAWPASTTAKPQSLSITENAVSLAVSIEGDAGSLTPSPDPAIFLRSFAAPTGMALEEPRVATLAGISRINLTLRPNAPATAASTDSKK